MKRRLKKSLTCYRNSSSPPCQFLSPHQPTLLEKFPSWWWILKIFYKRGILSVVFCKEVFAFVKCEPSKFAFDKCDVAPNFRFKKKKKCFIPRFCQMRGQETSHSSNARSITFYFLTKLMHFFSFSFSFIFLSKLMVSNLAFLYLIFRAITIINLASAKT